jgi:DNA-binding NarL/FixJ family response regulator
MRSLVVYESFYGNTEMIAQAIAAGLARHGEARSVGIGAVEGSSLSDVDVLVVGAPTHAWGLPLVGEGFLTTEAGLVVGAEVAATEQAARVIAAAQVAETQATLLAMTAEARAAEAIAASELIRTSAAAAAIRALIAAGLVEATAADEAVEALRAADLIVAAADEASKEAVAEAAATMRAASITMAEARVLRYLPTKSTFAVIADQLGISRSAAKERAERAYKKLGVHSRAEAVSRSRALGLIDEIVKGDVSAQQTDIEA